MPECFKTCNFIMLLRDISADCPLHIRERKKFIVACLVRQSLSGQAPAYVADNCCLVSDSALCSLQSADVQTCVVPQTYSRYGDRTCAAAGPRL